MKRLAGAVIGTLLLALAAGGGASASPLSVPARRKAGKTPLSCTGVDFPTVDIDLNQNGFVCAFNLPQDPRFFQLIDDVAQVP